ncbi:MAG: NADP-dependent oxidoreductase [SAR86 cluster bacterium]|nr:NADP-dependent oxidoreductase [SAR86 cluster bacterium]
MRNNNRQWILKKRPVGDISNDDLELIESKIPEPGPGQALIQNIYLSIDPTNRIWMSDIDQYMPPVELGQVMRGGCTAKIIKSNSPELTVGEYVSAFTCGWQDFAIVTPAETSPLPEKRNLPLTSYMSAAGFTGYTAYFGLLNITNPQPGETLVVSTAAGAVGSVVGQIGKIKGCKVIGITGSNEKCNWLKDIGFDGVINYKEENVLDKLKELCPEGVDIYFDNTGGEILDAVLTVVNQSARVSVCGLISMYNEDKPVPGPYMYRNILMKRVKVEGFIVSDFIEDWEKASIELAQWIQEGKIQYKVDIQQGLENALSTVNMLFTGENDGKLILQVSEE